MAPLQYGKGLYSRFSQTSRPLVHKLCTLSQSKVSTKFRIETGYLHLHSHLPSVQPLAPLRPAGQAGRGEGLANIALDCVSTDQSDLIEAIRSNFIHDSRGCKPICSCAISPAESV